MTGRLGSLRRAHGATSASFDPEVVQLRRMLMLGFLLFLLPATIGRLTGWRWRPWPPGSKGYRSIIGEARAAAETYIPLGFTGS